MRAPRPNSTDAEVFSDQRFQLNYWRNRQIFRSEGSTQGFVTQAAFRRLFRGFTRINFAKGGQRFRYPLG